MSKAHCAPERFEESRLYKTMSAVARAAYWKLSPMDRMLISYGAVIAMVIEAEGRQPMTPETKYAADCGKVAASAMMESMMGAFSVTREQLMDRSCALVDIIIGAPQEGASNVSPN